MAQVKEIVSTALRLDSSNQQREAYIKYLESVSMIVRILSQDAVTDIGVSEDSVKLAKLGKQCMDRLSELATNLNSFSTNRQRYADLPSPTAPATNQRSLSVDQLPSPPSGLRESVRQIRAQVSPPVRQDSLDDPGPIEMARRQNEALLAAYKTRMESVSKNRTLAASMNLSLQRRIAENLSVAKAKEESLARKMRDRHKRMTEEAARMMESSNGISQEELERRQLLVKVLQFEQNKTHLLSWREKLKAKPGSTKLIEALVRHIISINEHPVTQLLYKYQYNTYNKLQPLLTKYTKVHDQNTLKKGESNSKSRSTSNHDSSSHYEDGTSRERSKSDDGQSLKSTSTMDTGYSSLATTASVSTDRSISCEENPRTSQQMSIDSSQSHVISEEVIDSSDEAEETFESIKDDLYHLQPFELESLEADALERHLTNIVQDVQQFLDKLVLMFAVAFVELDTPVARDVCYSCVEQPFFKPVWPYILALFRLVHKASEDQLSCSMTTHAQSIPCDMGIRDRLALSEQVPTKYGYPYEPAVLELRQLTALTSPLTKLECLVRASKIVVNCVTEHYQVLGSKAPEIGADDLLPILSYCVVRSQLSQLFSEFQALEQFIHEGYLLGEEGYCLTSFQTAISFIIQRLDQSD